MSCKLRLKQQWLIAPGLALLFGAAPLLAGTITVTSGADAGGTCPGTDCSLRQAIATAVSGDTINFAPSVTVISLTTDRLLINKNLTISGPGADSLTVVRSAQALIFRIFDVLR